jgi:hypothetical protein
VIPSSEGTAASSDAPAAFVPATARALGDATANGPAPDAPASDLADPERSAPVAPVDSAPIDDAGSAALDEKGRVLDERAGVHDQRRRFAQARWTHDRARRWSYRRTSSPQTGLPVTAAESYARPDHDGHSPRGVRGHRTPREPKHPGSPVNAGSGSSSGTLFGIGVAALLSLITCRIPIAPRRRSVPPADRPTVAPFIPRLNPPG